MPELPEVETLRRGLEKYVVGHKILEVEVRDKKLLVGYEKYVVGKKIIAAKRFGKGLVIDLSNGSSIAIHIKLTGQFVFRSPSVNNLKLPKQLIDGIPSKFTRIIFKLDRGAVLYFNDIRRFAWMRVVPTSEVGRLPFFVEMGPEPFKDLGFKYFQTMIKKSSGSVKSALMDQKKIGGVGNIYANDALNLARIDPRRKGTNLSSEEIKKLFDAIHEVLKNGLKYGGATEINYVNILGLAGQYQNHFLVYGREGEKCKNCAGIIKKIKIAGRGTYFCPNCQV